MENNEDDLHMNKLEKEETINNTIIEIKNDIYENKIDKELNIKIDEKPNLELSIKK